MLHAVFVGEDVDVEAVFGSWTAFWPFVGFAGRISGILEILEPYTGSLIHAAFISLVSSTFSHLFVYFTGFLNLRGPTGGSRCGIPRNTIPV